jgi:hypothetical protein
MKRNTTVPLRRAVCYTSRQDKRNKLGGMDMTSYTWNGVTGHWRNASDWSPAGGPPTASDAATLGGSETYTVIVRLSDFASSLTLSDPNATLNERASLTIGGALTISDGMLNFSSSSHEGLLTVGALNLSGGALTIGSGAELDLNGTLSQTGGTLTLENGGTIQGGTIDSTAGTLNFQSGELSGVTFDGPLNLTSEQQTVSLANGATVVGSSGSGPGVINVTGDEAELAFEDTQTLSNTTINLGNGNNVYSDNLSATATGYDQVLTLTSTVAVDVQGLSSISIGSDVGYPNELVNQGVIDQTGSGGRLAIASNTLDNSGTIDGEASKGSLVIDPLAFTNNGAIHVGNGDIATIDSAVTGEGTETISGDSTLEFKKGVSSAETLGDQDIDFTGAGTLHLLKPAGFYGEISDFAAGDKVELKGTWDFSGISQAGGTTTLTLARGSTTHGFEFVGDYGQSDFSITPGNPTTTIKFA